MDYLDLLKHNEFFQDLYEDEQVYLAESLEKNSFAEGEVVFDANTIGDALFMLGKGKVAVEIPLDTEVYHRIAILYPGDVFGEMSILEGEPRNARILAITQIQVLVLKRSVMEQILINHPQLATKIYKHLARRLSRRLRFMNDNFIRLFASLFGEPPPAPHDIEETPDQPDQDK